MRISLLLPFVSPFSSFLLRFFFATKELFCITFVVLIFSVWCIIHPWRKGWSTYFKKQLSCWCFDCPFMREFEVVMSDAGKCQNHCYYGVAFGVFPFPFIWRFSTVGSWWRCCYWQLFPSICFYFNPRMGSRLVLAGVLVFVVTFR